MPPIPWMLPVVAKPRPRPRPPAPRAAPAPPWYPTRSDVDLAQQQAGIFSQPLIDYYTQQSQAARAQAQADAASQRARYAALAEILKGVAPNIQGIYREAGDSQATYAKGLAGGLAADQAAAAGQVNDILGAAGSPQGQMVSPSAGQQAGNALYTLGGYIPASTFAREGAAFASAAGFLPNTALGQGEVAARDALAKGDAETARLRSQIEKLVAEQPAKAMELLGKLQSRRFDYEKFGADQAWRADQLAAGKAKTDAAADKAAADQALDIAKELTRQTGQLYMPGADGNPRLVTKKNGDPVKTLAGTKAQQDRWYKRQQVLLAQGRLRVSEGQLGLGQDRVDIAAGNQQIAQDRLGLTQRGQQVAEANKAGFDAYGNLLPGFSQASDGIVVPLGYDYNPKAPPGKRFTKQSTGKPDPTIKPAMKEGALGSAKEFYWGTWEPSPQPMYEGAIYETREKARKHAGFDEGFSVKVLDGNGKLKGYDNWHPPVDWDVALSEMLMLEQLAGLSPDQRLAVAQEALARVYKKGERGRPSKPQGTRGSGGAPTGSPLAGGTRVNPDVLRALNWDPGHPDTKAANKVAGGSYGASLADIIIRTAIQVGLDPAIPLAIVPHEGGLEGAVGDNGNSYGPFQLYRGGKLPEGMDDATARRWANSPQGILYALKGIKAAVGDAQGAEAVEIAIREFEVPAAQYIEGEIQKARATYEKLIAAKGAGAQAPVGIGAGIAEAFYDPIGQWDQGRFSPKGIGGHSDHVHLSITNPQTMLAAIKKAQQLGLAVRENPYVDPVDPVHVDDSFHYKTFPGLFNGKKLGQGIDVSGAPEKMAAFFNWARGMSV